MAIKNWHGGKIALVWVVGLATGLPLLRFGLDNAWYLEGGGEDMVIVLVLLGSAVALLVTPLIVSWKWFSAREK